MEINSDQMIEVLNERAQSDPLIKEILRSTAYEVVVRAQSAQVATVEEAEEAPEGVEEEEAEE